MSHAAINESQRIAGCRINPLDEAVCGRYLAWLAGKSSKPEGADGVAWALGHFDDGVTWGRWDRETTSWSLSHDVAPNVSPAIRALTLQELRFFGEQREVLIWRTSAGIRGREVTDESNAPVAEVLLPSNEPRVLRGDRTDRTFENGFTLVSDATGARQVLPIRVTEQQLRSRSVRLLVRHYFERDDATGAVRVAMSRLVTLQGGGYGA